MLNFLKIITFLILATLKTNKQTNTMKCAFLFSSKLAIIFFTLLFAKPVHAQETIVSYLKKNGAFTAIKDSADYTRIIQLTPNDASLFELNEYYPNGNLKRHGWVKAPDPKLIRFEGLVETYYDNEILEAALHYTDNKLIDTAKRYYRNGVLKESRVYLNQEKNQKLMLDPDTDSRLVYYADSLDKVYILNGNGNVRFVDKDKDYEQGDYADGIRVGHWTGTMHKGKYRFEEWYEKTGFVNGETTDSLGQKIKYTQKQIQPEYPGGIHVLRTFIGNNYKYPRGAMSAQVAGQVTINFVVEKDGKVSNYKILNDLGYGTGKAGLEVLKRASDWAPGYMRGVPVRVAYTLPIRLNLSR